MCRFRLDLEGGENANARGEPGRLLSCASPVFSLRRRDLMDGRVESASPPITQELSVVVLFALVSHRKDIHRRTGFDLKQGYVSCRAKRDHEFS